MSSSSNPSSLYPKIDDSAPQHLYDPNPSSAPPLYPTLDAADLDVENLFPDTEPSAPPDSAERLLIRIPGSILHLIDDQYSVQLAIGDLAVYALLQGDNVVAVIACVDNEFQWPLTKDAAAVKLDGSHYFFSFNGPERTESDSDSSDDDDDGGKNKKKGSGKAKGKSKGKSKGKAEDSKFLNYGLTIASKGQEGLVNELDAILEKYSAFSVQQVKAKDVSQGGILDTTLAKEMSPEELEKAGPEAKRVMEARSTAYWTTLAPNVEEYSGTAAKLIAVGSGQLIRGILWCGDVTVDRLNWSNEVLMKRIAKGDKDAEIDQKTLKRLKRAKKMTRMTEKVAIGVLSGVVRVSGFFTKSVANSKVGKKFFALLPGEIVLASLDGFNKVCDAVEVAGRNVMSTSSTVTTGLVTHKYGEQAGQATEESLHAAGHAVGTAWTVFKIRKALDPKSVVKPSNIAKTVIKNAAEDLKSKSKKSK
ncbi:hypothetical protein MLD38_007820 [Melastoma candidum]|uniref:Uncharacterized protein n=1 Tax=Melastoma candidum TaxID=119954 RepID=A0ACB9RS05_9MYRT|nr:hypothetical protein MLD38_007820 [Melastoma candidum]